MPGPEQRWQKALGELRVLWGGVSVTRRWPRAVRSHEATGPSSPAEVVHQGVAHDLEADTTRAEALECARTIGAHVK
ncbi:phosphotransferase-like protein [Streptomyces chrestomyceticus]|uniref:phosphotransferase-like protein n=1 Tax=Streptomyces chrestomyceticus TaxID=68185 RepID=UPI00379415D1